MTDTGRPEAKSRQQTFADKADTELGLTAIEVKGGQFAAPCRAVVELRMAGARETPDSFPLTKLQIVGIIAERAGERVRVISHGGHFIDEVVTVGGNDGADSEGVGGLWTVVSISKHATDPAALAIQRASLHRTFRRDQLPDGVKAIPEGMYKDARAPKEKSFSLWSDQRLHKVGNRKLQTSAMAALVLAGRQRTAGRPIDQSGFEAPRLLVAADNVQPLKPRFVATDTVDVDLFVKAQDMIDDVAAWRSARGAWDIDGLLKAGCRGVVEKIHPQTGAIHITGDGADEVFEKPTEQLIDLIQKRTGFYIPDLQLFPLVSEKEQVGPETVLFGPVERLEQATRQKLRRISSAEQDNGAWLRSVRLMALLASATEINGRMQYPIELVAPFDARQISVQVAGDGINGRWDTRVQRVELDRHPSKHLVSAGLGYVFDLFNTSHRTLAMKKIKDFRQRTREREEAERKAKQAASVTATKVGAAPETAEATAEATE